MKDFLSKLFLSFVSDKFRISVLEIVLLIWLWISTIRHNITILLPLFVTICFIGIGYTRPKVYSNSEEVSQG